MGLFGGDSVTSVGTTVSRVVDDRNVPDAAKTGLVKALIQDQDLVPTVLDGLINSIGLRGERLYDYAAKGKYPYGLPSGHFTLSTVNRTQIEEALLAKEGQPVVVEYAHYGQLNLLHAAWQQIIATQAYNPTTNVIGSIAGPKGQPCYLDSLVVKTSAAFRSQLDSTSLAGWGVAPGTGPRPGLVTASPQLIDATQGLFSPVPIQAPDANYAGPPIILLGYSYSTVGFPGFYPPEDRRVIQVGFPAYNAAADYLQMCYTVGGQRKYVTYTLGSGTYPTLDTLLFAGTQYGGYYFPITYFRYDWAAQDANRGSAAYLASKKMLKYIGLDYQYIVEEVHKNPSIDDVIQAMMWLAVPAKSTHPIDVQYLYRYFDQQYTSQGAAEVQRDLMLTYHQLDDRFFRGWGSGQLTWASIIQDARIKFVVGHSGITKRMCGGNIAAVGGYAASGLYYTTRPFEWVGEEGQTTTVYLKEACFAYRYQLAYGWYTEIVVYAPKMAYYIEGNYKSLGNEDEDILLIPIDHSISEHFNVRDREQLYSRSLHFIFNSMVTTEVAWYQSSFFTFVVMAVALVFSVQTLGNSLALVTALAAAGMYSSLAIVLLEGLVLGLAVSQGLKIFTKMVGPEVAMAIAIVATVVAATAQISAGGLANAPWAGQMLSVSNGLINSVGEYYKDAMKGLQEDYKVFQEESKELYDGISKANDLLRSDSVLTPLMIIGESYSDYFDRTIHNTNPGINTITGVSTFVDRSLTLPTPAQTLGDMTYGYQGR
jgi:hypothetical protein